MSVIGLVIVAIVTLQIFNGRLALPGTSGPGASGNGGAVRTPAPSNVVVVPTLPPEVVIPGTLVYAKAGNVWVQSGGTATQLTGGSATIGRDSMPSFSPDGRWVYFVRTETVTGRWPVAGSGNRNYELTIPRVARVPTDGSARPEVILDGRISRSGGLTWFFWLRQPVLGPDGRTIAVMSDGPDPTASNVVLQFLDAETGQLSKPSIPETAPLGHQDPAWRPDGRVLLLVRNGRDGSRGAPEIWRYSLLDERVRRLTNPGYLHPAWSRDQRWLAATKTTAFGTDIVVLSPTSGAELFRVTRDGRSWAPVWSPTGDAIAFLHSDGQIVDLRMVQLDGTAPAWTVSEPIALTELSGLDTGSRPGWFIPESELPPLPTPTPRASAAPSASG